MSLIRKAINRMIRITLFKKGIYGHYGRSNKFTQGVFVSESAKIGKYNYFGPYVMLNNAQIGNYCSIGPGVKIGQGDHSASYITTYQKISSDLTGHSLNKTPTIVGNDVWCGANVVIMQGITVGNGAIIGSNAVVTKDVPPYAIAVGVPAKIIKYRFNDNVINEIQKSNWFNYDIKKAKEIIKSLESIL